MPLNGSREIKNFTGNKKPSFFVKINNPRQIVPED
jgi:hypothetical protein